MGVTRKQSTRNFLKMERFVPPDMHTHVFALVQKMSY